MIKLTNFVEVNRVLKFTQEKVMLGQLHRWSMLKSKFLSQMDLLI